MWLTWRLEACQLCYIIVRKVAWTFAAMTSGGASAMRIRMQGSISFLLPPRLLPASNWVLREQWHGIRTDALDGEQKTRGWNRWTVRERRPNWTSAVYGVLMKYHADIATIMTTTLGSAVQVTTIQVASHAVRLGGCLYSIVLSWLQIHIHGIYYTNRTQMAQVHTVLLHVEYYSLSVVIMYMLYSISLADLDEAGA